MSEKRRTLTDARRHLSKLVRDAERGHVTIVTRRGVDVAVVMSAPRYRALQEARSSDGPSILDTLTGAPPMDALRLERQDDMRRPIDLES